MEKINFVNNQPPYINAENLNAMQSNIENAIGEIIESGSNSNGNWIKYSDGTLIQWGETTFGTSGTSSDSYKLVTFPITFINGSYSMITQARYTGNVSQIYALGTILTPSQNTNTTSNYVYRRLSYLSPIDSGQNVLYSQATPFFWIAIGKWK